MSVYLNLKNNNTQTHPPPPPRQCVLVCYIISNKIYDSWYKSKREKTKNKNKQTLWLCFIFVKLRQKVIPAKKTQPPVQCFWCISKQEKIKWEHSQSLQSYFYVLIQWKIYIFWDTKYPLPKQWVSWCMVLQKRENGKDTYTDLQSYFLFLNLEKKYSEIKKILSTPWFKVES